MEMKEEPPSSSCSTSTPFLIGKNKRGNWVVQDQEGLCGGLFADRAAALKFAMFEKGTRPRAVIMVPGVFELDMNSKPLATHPSTVHAEMPLQRVAKDHASPSTLFNIFIRRLAGHDPLHSHARG
jgi:hypothetical protein